MKCYKYTAALMGCHREMRGVCSVWASKLSPAHTHTHCTDYIRELIYCPIYNIANKIRGFGIDSCCGIEIHHIKKTLHKVISRNHKHTLSRTQKQIHTLRVHFPCHSIVPRSTLSSLEMDFCTHMTLACPLEAYQCNFLQHSIPQF